MSIAFRLVSKILLLVFSIVAQGFWAQNYQKFSHQNAHSHNDYLQPIPFQSAFNRGFGSIEVDIFYVDGSLYVAHDKKEIRKEATLESLYLIPLENALKENSVLYGSLEKSLVLLIDIKDDHRVTLPRLTEVLKKFPLIINSKQIKIAISGNRPKPSDFHNYPNFINFDGLLDHSYTKEALERVVYFSDNLKKYTSWNGKGIPRDEDKAKIKAEIAHKQGKGIRFWNAPDFINAWVNLIDLNVDYIGTDNVESLGSFLETLPKRFYKSNREYSIYTPTYKNDGADKKAKNVILLIADGTSLPQYYSAFTANGGKLNIFGMKYSGLSKTTSANAYITDSAPGSSSFASGVKTKNNFVGVDKDGNPVEQIPDFLGRRKIKSALVSSGDITDATPADFYGHTTNRDDSKSILKDFISSPVSMLIGGPTQGLDQEISKAFSSSNIAIYQSLKEAKFSSEKTVVVDTLASKNYVEGRRAWLADAFDKAVEDLEKNKDGFFLMLEASRTDGNGHSNDLPNVVSEMQDFDHVVGKALKYADTNGETLVIVLGDHETGGLTLVDGNIEEKWVVGNFSSNDHTAIPAIVFSYGPQAQNFTGFYENTEVFSKILKAFQIAKP